MLVLLLLSLIAPGSSQLMYYYLYPSYYPTTPALQYQQGPAYATPQQYICGSPANYQYQATPCTSSNYNPSCETECQSTPYCQRFDSTAQCVNGCCNSTEPNPNSNLYNPTQNTNGVARDNGINDITCPFNDPSAGLCVDRNCPSGFVCNQDNVCCPCAVGAAQGACSAGSCSSSALRCESASGMCCPRPLNGTASGAQNSPGASGYPQLQYTPGLQQQQQPQQFPQQQQQYGNQQQFQPQQQQYPQQQYPQQSQQGGQFPQQQPYGGQPQFQQQQQPQINYGQQPQNQYQPQQNPQQFNYDSRQQNQFQQPQSQQGGQFPQQQQPQPQQQQFNQNGQQNQFQPQQQPQFGQQNNGQQSQFTYNTQSPNQYQPSQNTQSSQNPQNNTTPFVYNTQNPNPTSTVRPQGSTTTVPTIYPSSG